LRISDFLIEKTDLRLPDCEVLEVFGNGFDNGQKKDGLAVPPFDYLDESYPGNLQLEEVDVEFEMLMKLIAHNIQDNLLLLNIQHILIYLCLFPKLLFAAFFYYKQHINPEEKLYPAS